MAYNVYGLAHRRVVCFFAFKNQTRKKANCDQADVIKVRWDFERKPVVCCLK
jgi:hypothetical protein